MPRYVITPKTVTIEAESPEEAVEKFGEAIRSDDWIDQLEALPESDLAEALQFYADPESYWAIFIVPDRPAGLFADDIGCCLLDEQHDHRHGRTARRALGDEWGGTEPCEDMLAEMAEGE